MYKGQAYPSVETKIKRSKISDGLSVEVAIPKNAEVKANEFIEVDGWHGFTFAGVTKTDTERVVAVNIEQCEYETSQIASETFNVGADLYFDKTAKKLTVTKASNTRVGRVTKAKNADGAICFILAAQA